MDSHWLQDAQEAVGLPVAQGKTSWESQKQERAEP